MLFAETSLNTVAAQSLGGVVIACAVILIVRQWEVRFVLLAAGLALSLLAQTPDRFLANFLSGLADESTVVPICLALAFAHVVRHAGCDRHLVHLLVGPIRKMRSAVVPGVVVVGFLVNMPIISQTGCAATLGPVVLPLCKAAGVSPVHSAAALVLGCSIGGELLNPGAPEYSAVCNQSEIALKTIDIEGVVPRERCVQRVFWLNLLNLLVATAAMWMLTRRSPADPSTTEAAKEDSTPAGDEPVFRVNLFKAMVPLVPLVFLYLTAPPFQVIEIPSAWLVKPGQERAYETRLIGLAMAIGVVVAMLATPRKSGGAITALFEGAGYAYTHVISLIVVGKCFASAVRDVGIAERIGTFVGGQPAVLVVTSCVLCLGFAMLCGSGIAPTQSLFGFFAGPAVQAGVDPVHSGVLCALAAAAGRTMSPVSAVVQFSAKLGEVSPFEIVRTVAWPLILSITATAVAGMIWAPSP